MGFHRRYQKKNAAARASPEAGPIMTKEATAPEFEAGHIPTKTNQAMVDLAGGLLASNKPTADGTKRKEATGASSEAGDHHNRGRKRKESSASEDYAAAHKEKEEGDSLFKEGEMLKLREEFWEAERLWKEKLIPGALDRWLKRKETETTQVPAGAGKKRKVVRVILPDNYIDYIQENPDIMRELTDEEMAECPERFRQKYAIIKLINDKSRAYQQALIDQYQAFGFAYDEKEVTDDEEDEAVMKN